MISATGSDSHRCVSSPRTASGTARASTSAPVGLGALQGDREPAPLRIRKVSVRSLRNLADQFGQPREGQPSVELRRSDRQHPSPPALGQLVGDLQQAALPDAGIADGDRASAARPGRRSGLAARPRGRTARTRPPYLLHEGIILQPTVPSRSRVPARSAEGFPRCLARSPTPSVTANLPPTQGGTQ